MLYNEIQKIIYPAICESKDTYLNFLKRLEEGDLTRDENLETHFYVYFLPYNQKDRKVFITHHKKSGLWISPGGHIDKEEGLLEALNREIREELGVKSFFKEAQAPFLLTITRIGNKVQFCRAHYDIWHMVLTDGADFNIDPREFHETRWLAIDEAEKIVADPSNRKALEIIRKKYE